MPDPNYNPQKAHEYYLRTRQLKGRAAAAAVISSPRPRAAAKPVAPPKKAVKTRAQHNREVTAQVVAFTQRLERLRETLRAMVEAAKARSGVKPTKQQQATAKKASPAAKKASSQKLSAKEKADAAKRAKAYYEKHKNDTPDQQLKVVLTKIKDVEAKIKVFKEEADKAAAARRKRAGSVGASKTTQGRRGSK